LSRNWGLLVENDVKDLMLGYNYFMKTQGPMLSLVIPVFNEALSIPIIFPGLISGCKEKNYKLIVVDDGSTDETFKLLDQLEKDNSSLIQIIHHKVNHGYGGALKTGIQVVDTPYLLTMDADGQHVFDDVSRTLEMMIEQNADLIVGKRTGDTSGWFRSLGKWLIRIFANFLVPLGDIDLNSGFKMLRSDLAKKYCAICPDGMAFSDVITISFLFEKKLVVGQPIQTRKRVAGKSTIGIGTAFDTTIEILNMIMLFNPLKIFLPASALFILFGLLWGLPIIFMGRGVSVGSMLAIVLGMLLFLLGLLAHQLSEIRLSALR
jgi:glycosyltransferase involved in cell wall biosynthesis